MINKLQFVEQSYCFQKILLKSEANLIPKKTSQHCLDTIDQDVAIKRSRVYNQDKSTVSSKIECGIINFWKHLEGFPQDTKI